MPNSYLTRLVSLIGYTNQDGDSTADMAPSDSASAGPQLAEPTSTSETVSSQQTVAVSVAHGTVLLLAVQVSML